MKRGKRNVWIGRYFECVIIHSFIRGAVRVSKSKKRILGCDFTGCICRLGDLRDGDDERSCCWTRNNRAVRGSIPLWAMGERSQIIKSEATKRIAQNASARYLTSEAVREMTRAAFKLFVRFIYVYVQPIRVSYKYRNKLERGN